MLMSTDDSLHSLARAVAASLRSPDRKQLRFNEIVAAARDFYPSAVEAGVVELVQSCDREGPAPASFIGPMPANALYVRKAPMWRTMWDQYGWMSDAEN